MDNFKERKDVKEKIDLVDSQIVKMIAERCSLVEQGVNLKTPTNGEVKAPPVEFMIQKVRKLGEDNNLSPNVIDVIEVVYRSMISAFANQYVKKPLTEE